MYASQNLPNGRKDQLIKGLTQLPDGWALTPLLGNKAPYLDGWQHETPRARADIQKAIQQGEVVTYRKKDGSTYQKRQFPQGYGVRTGPISKGIVAVDIDGPSAALKVIEMSGGAGLPKTVVFTSGRPGRAQYAFRIPEQYWDAVKTTKFKTGVNGDDGKPEQVELRWEGLQSALPPSVHPITGAYHWVEGCAPWETEIAAAPMWLIELMLSESSPLLNHPVLETAERSTEPRWTNRDWALSYLDGLSASRADNYDEWLNVGMALHSVDDSLLNEWDGWSRKSSKYQAGECERKWKSFKGSGLSIGSLAHMAKQDGWRSPFERRGTPAVERYRSSKVVPHPSFNQAGGNGNSPQSLENPYELVKALVCSGVSQAQLSGALIELATSTGYQLGGLNSLAKEIEAELSLQSAQSDDARETSKLLEYREQTLDLRRVFPATLANYLLTKANSDRVDPVYLYQYLWSAIGLSLGAHIGIEGKKGASLADNWVEFPIYYNMTVAAPSSGKSQTMRSVLGPIKRKQDRTSRVQKGPKTLGEVAGGME